MMRPEVYTNLYKCAMVDSTKHNIVYTLITETGLEQIKRVNIILLRLSGHNRNLSPLEARYRIELVQSFLDAKDDIIMYKLRILRVETHNSMDGAHNIVCEYSIELHADGTTESGISTFKAANLHGNPNLYLNRGFATLVTHMWMFCSVSAGLIMNISAVHPATMHLYRKYDAFASEVNELHRNPDVNKRSSVTTKGFSIGHKWKNVGEMAPDDGIEIHNAKLTAALLHNTEFTQTEVNEFELPYMTKHTYIRSGTSYFQLFSMPVCIDMIFDATKMTQEQKQQLKDRAVVEINKVLQRMAQNRETTLDASVFTPYTNIYHV